MFLVKKNEDTACHNNVRLSAINAYKCDANMSTFFVAGSVPSVIKNNDKNNKNNKNNKHLRTKCLSSAAGTSLDHACSQIAFIHHHCFALQDNQGHYECRAQAQQAPSRQRQGEQGTPCAPRWCVPFANGTPLAWTPRFTGKMRCVSRLCCAVHCC